VTANQRPSGAKNAKLRVPWGLAHVGHVHPASDEGGACGLEVVDLESDPRRREAEAVGVVLHHLAEPSPSCPAAAVSQGLHRRKPIRPPVGDPGPRPAAMALAERRWPVATLARLTAGRATERRVAS